LLSLPTRYGGLNIVNPVEEASLQLDASRKITEPLKKMIIEQSDSYRKPDLCEIRAKLRQQKANHHASQAKIIRESLPRTRLFGKPAMPSLTLELIIKHCDF
jgi:hypothetical protein